MLGENKNLKDSTASLELALKDNISPVNYSKTNKLISALYMVTDIMDKEEPLRTKLRNLGTNIISDIYSLYKGQSVYNQINNRVSEILSFMEVATSVGIISEMNSNILTKEFMELKKSITETASKNRENWLEEFMKEDKNLETKIFERRSIPIGQKNFSIQQGTRIGVQKGSTLLKALSDKIPDLRTPKMIKDRDIIGFDKNHVDVLKSKRREEIILVIKDKMKDSQNFDGATITDIKSNGHEMIALCGEKTLQRELTAMVSSGVLRKKGEKRWSRYLLN